MTDCWGHHHHRIRDLVLRHLFLADAKSQALGKLAKQPSGQDPSGT